MERQLTEHGALPWAALEQSMAGEDWHAQAQAWVSAATAEEEQGFDDLQRVLQRLWIEHLGAQAQLLAVTGDDLPRLRELHARIGKLKAGLTLGLSS